MQEDSNVSSELKNEHHSLSHAYSTYLAHDVEEQTHWEDVCRSYRQYATFAMAQWANHQYRLHALPEEQRRLLPPALKRETTEFACRAKSYKEAAIRNQFCLDCILRHAGQVNSQDALLSRSPSLSEQQSTIQHSTDSQMSKVSSVLKSLARDWSSEGKVERDLAYGPIIKQVQKYLVFLGTERMPPRNHKQFADPSSQNGVVQSNSNTCKIPPRLCVPGAGVGRLACELAALGYDVQGNEFSLYMLLASDFILNGGMATPDHPLQISPFLLESRNVHSPMDPSRPITIPDVDPHQMIMSVVASSHDNHLDDSDNADLSDSGRLENDSVAGFSMAAGEFVSIYGNAREKERWDGFVACFFLDTAPCIVEYISVMHKSLKPGGFVFHFGPLLWHWSGPAMRPDDKTWEAYQSRYSYLDKKYMISMDLSWHDVRQIFMNAGFDILEEKTGARALYTSDQRSMMNMTYHCIDFVAQKRYAPRVEEHEGTKGLY